MVALNIAPNQLQTFDSKEMPINRVSGTHRTLAVEFSVFYRTEREPFSISTFQRGDSYYPCWIKTTAIPRITSTTNPQPSKTAECDSPTQNPALARSLTDPAGK